MTEQESIIEHLQFRINELEHDLHELREDYDALAGELADVYEDVFDCAH